MPSDEFFAKIMAYPIPTDLEAVKLLAPAPAAMDLFIWLSYRRDTATGRESIPLFGPGKWSLAHQISTVDSYPPPELILGVEIRPGVWNPAVRVSIKPQP